MLEKLEMKFKFGGGGLNTFNGIGQGLLDLDGRNSQKYLHQTWADF